MLDTTLLITVEDELANPVGVQIRNWTNMRLAAKRAFDNCMQRLQNPKWPTPRFLGPAKYSYDSNSHSRRNIDTENGEKKQEKKEKNNGNSGPHTSLVTA